MQIELQQLISEVLSSELGVQREVSKVFLEHPADPTHGDWSTNVAMTLAQELKLPPRTIADKLVSALQAKVPKESVSKVEVAGAGFINFHLGNDVFKHIVADILTSKAKFGINQDLQDKTYLVEHTSPNPNKEFHLGHLKNNVTGLAISYLLEANGAKVFRDCIDNNRGIAIAKLMWGYLKFARKQESTPVDIHHWFTNRDEWFTPEEKGVTPGLFMDKLYTKGAEDCKLNDDSDKIVRQMVVEWEASEPHNIALWKQTQDWVWEGYRQSLGRVNGWHFDQIWHESDIYKQGKEHVQRGLQQGIFRQLEDGAVLTDLKKGFNLPDTVVIKNDGTALYITQDLELTKLKRERFNPDFMLWVIGPEQSLQMKQMFAVCSQLGFGKFDDYKHIPYGFMLIKKADGSVGKMSSREGSQVYVNELIDQAKIEIQKFFKSDMSEEDKEQIAEKVAIGAIKYSLLRVNRAQDMVFDFHTSIAFEGDSAPYLMYTYTRAKSMLTQADSPVSTTEYDSTAVLNSEVEMRLIKKLGRFETVIRDSVKDFAPHLVTNYLYELAQDYNTLYNSLPVLKAEEPDRSARLALTAATAQVIQNGLKLLGIETVERM